MMQRITFRDISAPSVLVNRLTPGEVDAVERATQLTLGKIRRMGSTCVCDHPQTAHLHKGDDGEVRADVTSCDRDCGCEEFAPDLPARFGTALMWVSLKRVEPTLKFADVNDSVDALTVDEVEDEDPQVAPES
jgi:hypothetical protein